MSGRGFDFGIDGYQPFWLRGYRQVIAQHGAQLHSLVGRVLTGTWLVWDDEDDSWFADCPVILDFGGEQVEINHQKFDELSITWNSIDPTGPVIWPGVDNVRLRWRDDVPMQLIASRGDTVSAVDLLEWFPLSTDSSVKGSLAPAFTIGHNVIMIYNALDENGLHFTPPTTQHRRHQLG